MSQDQVENGDAEEQVELQGHTSTHFVLATKHASLPSMSFAHGEYLISIPLRN
jgi:hypothetical protein